MVIEKSCGAVVFTYINGTVNYVIIANKAGIYGFPKGHMERGESELRTAAREIKEETGLDVIFINGFRTTDSHIVPENGHQKDSVYFLAYYENQTPKHQENELSSVSLCTYEDIIDKFQFESSKRILKEANCFLLKSHK